MLKLGKKFAKLTLNNICFTLVGIYEEFTDLYLAEVKLDVISPEVRNPEKIIQRKQNGKACKKNSKYRTMQKQSTENYKD